MCDETYLEQRQSDESGDRKTYLRWVKTVEEEFDDVNPVV